MLKDPMAVNSFAGTSILLCLEKREKKKLRKRKKKKSPRSEKNIETVRMIAPAGSIILRRVVLTGSCLS